MKSAEHAKACPVYLIIVGILNRKISHSCCFLFIWMNTGIAILFNFFVYQLLLLSWKLARFYSLGYICGIGGKVTFNQFIVYLADMW